MNCKPGPLTLFFVFVGLFPLLVGLAPVFGQGKKGKGKGRGPSLVRITKVTETDRNRTQNFVGTLRPVRRSIIGSAVDGRIEKVVVTEGSQVSAASREHRNPFVGQSLVEIKKKTLQIEIELAKIELTLRSHLLEELTNSIPKELELAESNVKGAEALYEFANLAAKNANQAAGALSKNELAEIQSRFQASLQALNGAKADFQKLTLTKDIRLNIAKQRVLSQQKELERLADLKSKYTIRAPFPGFVTKKLVEEGDWITKGQAAIEVIQMNPIELRINIPQKFQSQAQASFDQQTDVHPMMASVSIDSIADKLEGRVVQIIPEADARTRSIPLVIHIVNPQPQKGFLLKPGMLAHAEVRVGAPSKVLMVDKDAVVFGNQKDTIFVVEPGSKGVGRVRAVQVQTGMSSGQQIEIQGDVKDGDWVAFEGNERLRDGQAVKIIE